MKLKLTFVLNKKDKKKISKAIRRADKEIIELEAANEELAKENERLTEENEALRDTDAQRDDEIKVLEESNEKFCARIQELEDRLNKEGIAYLQEQLEMKKKAYDEVFHLYESLKVQKERWDADRNECREDRLRSRQEIEKLRSRVSELENDLELLLMGEPRTQEFNDRLEQFLKSRR